MSLPRGATLQINLPPRMVEWTEPERLAWKPPDDLSVSEWADRNRFLHPLTSAEPGKWSTERTPYLKEIMDAFSDPSVEMITFMASTQVGKTECLLNMMGYAIDQDPGALLLVMPREEDVISIGQRRIRPMLEASPQLSRHLSDHKTDNKNKEIRFTRSMMYLAGSNSPADLSSRPVRYVLGDEVDKWPAFSGKEASPVDLMIERTRTFWNRKIVIASTPTTRDGYIFKSYQRSDQRQYYVNCPHCDKSQVLVFPQIKWPEEQRDPAVIRSERLAWYECEHCQGHISDLDKSKMLQEGSWIPEGESTSHRGFQISAMYSPWLTWSDIAAKFLEAKDEPSSLMNVVNSWFGQPWSEKVEQVSNDEIAKRQKPYARGTVPEGAVVLTAGVDVQADHLWYVIRAWGPREESWLIEAGRLDTDLDGLVPIIINRQFTGGHRVRMTLIDSGYRTDEVYRFCRHWPDVCRPTKGQQKMSGVPIKASKIDRSQIGDPMKRSIRLFLIDTSHFKDKLNRMQTAQDGEHGAWHLHENVSDDYLKQVTSEHKVLKRNTRTGATQTVWTKKPGAGGNHLFDAEVYALASAEMLGVYALPDEKETPDLPPPPSPARSQESEWVQKRSGGWING